MRFLRFALYHFGNSQESNPAVHEKTLALQKLQGRAFKLYKCKTSLVAALPLALLKFALAFMLHMLERNHEEEEFLREVILSMLLVKY